MCFYTKTTTFKVAKRPIKVYKYMIGRKSPYLLYIYEPGKNIPLEKYFPIHKDAGTSTYIIRRGVLHARKTPTSKDIDGTPVEMYILPGTKYNDEGILDSYNDIVSKSLYWPKNKFERWFFNLISKKY